MPNITEKELEIIIEQIAQNDQNLINLDLANKGITDTQTLKIASALEQNSVLQKFNLNQNHITNFGAQALVNSLQNNVTIKNLSLEENLVFGETSLELDEILNRNFNFPHHIYVKIVHQYTKYNAAQNFSELELKFLSDVNNSKNCSKIFEFLCNRFARNQDPTNFLNSLKERSGVGLRFLTSTAFATTNDRSFLAPKVALALEKIDLLDFLKAQGVAKNNETIANCGFAKLSAENLQLIFKFLQFDDTKYGANKAAINVVDNDNFDIDNDNFEQEQDQLLPPTSPTNPTATLALANFAIHNI